MPLKIVIDFSNGKSGWSETYYSNLPFDTYCGAVGNRFGVGSNIAVLEDRRRSLLPRENIIERFRVTDIATNGMLAFDRELTGLYPTTSSVQQAEVYTALQMDCRSGTKKIRRLYLGGLPEAVVQGPQFYHSVQPWTGAMSNFITLLQVGSYGWVGRQPRGVNDVPITAFVVSPDGRTATVSPGAIPGGNPPFWYVIIRGMKDPRGWNGVHRAILNPAGGGIIIGPTRRTMVSDPPFQVNSKSVCGVLLTPFNVIDTVIDQKLVQRKRGRPFGTPRGRR